MNEKELTGMVHNSMYQQWKKRGYAAPVDTLMDCQVLSRKIMKTGGLEKFHIWRNAAR